MNTPLTAPLIEFFWDPVSPYTYLASTRIEALAQRVGARLEWKPFLLGPVFEAIGNRPNIAIAPKGRYMLDDLALLARHLGVPLQQPQPFPTNSVHANRAALAAPADQLPAFARALMRAYWGEGRDIGRPEIVLAVAAECGLDAPTLAERAQSPEIKTRLRELTDEAIARGVFGAPTFFVGGRMYWGNDRMDLMEAVLSGRLAV